jgi:hypothetical protein
MRTSDIERRDPEIDKAASEKTRWAAPDGADEGARRARPPAPAHGGGPRVWRRFDEFDTMAAGSWAASHLGFCVKAKSAPGRR